MSKSVWDKIPELWWSSPSDWIEDVLENMRQNDWSELGISEQDLFMGYSGGLSSE